MRVLGGWVGEGEVGSGRERLGRSGYNVPGFQNDVPTLFQDSKAMFQDAGTLCEGGGEGKGGVARRALSLGT
jgi:hypothetical protein